MNVPRPFKKIAFPMTGHSTVVDFCRPLSNGNGVEDLPLSRVSPRGRARLTKAVLTAQLF
jgi:hypothetical protein